MTAAASPSTAYRYYVLAILLLVYCLSFIDRQILAVLSPYIKDELNLSDTELGALKVEFVLDVR